MANKTHLHSATCRYIAETKSTGLNLTGLIFQSELDIQKIKNSATYSQELQFDRGVHAPTYMGLRIYSIDHISTRQQLEVHKHNKDRFQNALLNLAHDRFEGFSNVEKAELMGAIANKVARGTEDYFEAKQRAIEAMAQRKANADNG